MIKNKFNGNTTYVGNICVKRFMEIDARKLFAGLKKLQKNAQAKPNLDLIEYAMQQGYLYDEGEYAFIRKIMKKSVYLKDNKVGFRKSIVASLMAFL